MMAVLELVTINLSVRLYVCNRLGACRAVCPSLDAASSDVRPVGPAVSSEFLDFSSILTCACQGSSFLLWR